MKEDLMQWLQDGNIAFPRALLTNYKKMNINETELVLLLHVHSFLEKGNEFPTPEEIAGNMTVSVEQCANMLRSLIQKGCLGIEEGFSPEGIRFEKYTLAPLWEKVIDCFLLQGKKLDKENNIDREKSLYTIFEQEFGRPLSPFECETLAMWIDDDRHEPEIIMAALREAVMSGKLNFRYIDRILFEWKRNGIKTVEQAKNYGKKFRQHQFQYSRNKTVETNGQRKEAPFYNWLEQ